jgi:hypothetical protein
MIKYTVLFGEIANDENGLKDYERSEVWEY